MLEFDISTRYRSSDAGDLVLMQTPIGIQLSAEAVYGTPLVFEEDHATGLQIECDVTARAASGKGEVGRDRLPNEEGLLRGCIRGGRIVFHRNCWTFDLFGASVRVQIGVSRAITNLVDGIETLRAEQSAAMLQEVGIICNDAF